MTYPTVTEALRVAMMQNADVYLHADDDSIEHEWSEDCPCEPVLVQEYDPEID